MNQNSNEEKCNKGKNPKPNRLLKFAVLPEVKRTKYNGRQQKPKNDVFKSWSKAIGKYNAENKAQSKLNDIKIKQFHVRLQNTSCLNKSKIPIFFREF